MSPSAPVLFELDLAEQPLECGAAVRPVRVRGSLWGPARDREVLAARARVLTDEEAAGSAHAVQRRGSFSARQEPSHSAPSLDASVPTVLLVHALTGDHRPFGAEGWWGPVTGPGKPLDPERYRLVCLNNLGSCYGTSGPCDEDFPRDPIDPRLPVTLSTWDQAALLHRALDALGVGALALVTGGSLGGMISLCVAALRPSRTERLALFASSASASAWILGFNHVARQILALDPGFPEGAWRGLEVARQLAMLTYRAEPGLDARQGRSLAGGQRWPTDPYRIATYLEHQGHKLRERFDPRAYLATLGAMDHHDVDRVPPPAVLDFARAEPLDGASSWGLARVRCPTLAVDIDTDALYLPAQTERLVASLRAQGTAAERATLRSPHGHDAFLLEWAQVEALLARALSLPAQRTP